MVQEIGAAVAVELHRTVLVKRELSWKVKLSVYWSVYVATLTYRHKLWVVTERTRLRMKRTKYFFSVVRSGSVLEEVNEYKFVNEKEPNQKGKNMLPLKPLEGNVHQRKLAEHEERSRM